MAEDGSCEVDPELAVISCSEAGVDNCNNCVNADGTAICTACAANHGLRDGACEICPDYCSECHLIDHEYDDNEYYYREFSCTACDGTGRELRSIGDLQYCR